MWWRCRQQRNSCTEKALIVELLYNARITVFTQNEKKKKKKNSAALYSVTYVSKPSYPTTSAVQELQVTVSQAIAKTSHFHQVDMSCDRSPSYQVGDDLMTVQIPGSLPFRVLFICSFACSNW